MKKGFTLIELLVVISIIAILTGIILVNINTPRQKSRDAKRVSDLAQIQLGLELFFDRCNYYPTTLNPATSYTCGANTYTLGDFISRIPTPPSGSVSPVDGSAVTAYSYAALGTGSSCSSYHLGAVLEINDQTGALQDDNDATAGTACTGSAADFSGADTPRYTYDVTP